MATKKSLPEKILEMQNKKEQLENQIKQLAQKQKEEDRKVRTRRLIERGALLESFFDGAESLTNDQVKEILSAALASRDAMGTINTGRGYRRAENVMEPAVEEVPLRRREMAETPAEDAPFHRREPPQTSDELRRPRA